MTAAGPAIRLVVADDHPIVRAGLVAVLSAEPDIVVVGQAGVAAEAVAVAAAGGVDVVLMDLMFGGSMDGVAATRAITALAATWSDPAGQSAGPPKVLVLTTFDADADILPAIEAGAAGYLLKDAPPAELAAAVRAAAVGAPALAPVVAQRLLHRVRTPDRSLSAREIEVLVLVAQGLSNAQISARLHLSQATVKSHLVHIYTKLDVDSRTAAVAAATRRGLIGR